MPSTLESLEREVLSLSLEDRSHLFNRLVESLENEENCDEAWDAEAARRDAEIENGTVVALDCKSVIARLRAQLQ
jgi:hypothetical protein